MAIDSSIRQIINHNGYIAIDEMMGEVLTNNTSSYYRNIEHIGKEGDFITSPEISQLFGEVIGLWVIEQWQKLGKPKEFILLELGPGQGILMRDILRTVKLAPECLNVLKIKLYDVNPYFIEKQKHTLAQYNEDIEWIGELHHLENLSRLPLIVVSNEFFDALPIKQYKKLKKLWHEVVMVVDPADSYLKFDTIEINRVFQKQLKYEHPNAEEGAVVEESVPALNIVRKLASHINKYKGSFLAIDYGYNIQGSERLATQYNSTLQAIKNHQYHPIIASIGEADLSAHVDFNALARSIIPVGLKHSFISTQAEFLIKYGILIRLVNLQKANPGELSENLGKQVYRLTAKEQMGELFKVLEFWHY